MRATDASDALASLAGLRVLVIDPSSTVRRSAERFLTAAGCRVTLAEDGFDALSKIADQQPQLIFCDTQAPRLDGWRTCALVKQNPRYAAIPVVLLAANESLFDQARSRLAGAAGVLTKPFSEEALINAVNTHLQQA